MKRGAVAAMALAAALGLMVGSVQGKTRERRRGEKRESPRRMRAVCVCQQYEKKRVVCKVHQGLGGVIPLVCGGPDRMRGLEGDGLTGSRQVYVSHAGPDQGHQGWGPFPH